MLSKREDNLLKAFTGLESGVVAVGSTCGVVSGGAMGLALSHHNEIMEKGIPAEAGLLTLIGEYVNWFENKFGSSFCRDRSGVDWNSKVGLLRYFVPGDRLGKCLWHIRGAIRHLHSYRHKELPKAELEPSKKQDEPIHCAQLVLNGIKERTGTGNDLLERLSIVFDGGVGLQGGVCGALAGAIMGLSLSVGMNIREMNYFDSIKAFAVGHKNLLTNKPAVKPETLSLGKEIVNNFKEKAGAVECRAIACKKFAGWSDFQDFISSSDKCSELIELAKDQASAVIEKYSPGPK